MIKSDNRFLRWIDRQWLPALIAIAGAGVPLWGLVLDGGPPVKIISTEVLSPTVPRGGALLMRYNIDRRAACPGEIQRIIVDGQGVQHLIERYEILAKPISFKRDKPDLEEAQPRPDAQPLRLGVHELTVSAPVPVGAAPGKARYQAVVHYFCNWVQKALNMPVDVETPVTDFEITHAEAEKVDPGIKLPNADPNIPVTPLPKKRSDLGPLIHGVPVSWRLSRD